MTRAITGGEQTLFRTEGHRSKIYLAIDSPDAVYTARINQTFTGTDMIAQITYDGGSGTLGNVLPGMTMLIGSTAGAHDIGILRIRKTPSATVFYHNEVSDVDFDDDQYIAILNEFGIWAKHLRIVAAEAFLDYDVDYSDQHTSFIPVPVMGSDLVLWLPEAVDMCYDCIDDNDVSITLDGSDSWVSGSTISAYLWTAPGASATSGLTSATPTITYNQAGRYRIGLKVTAANGKDFTGYRNVYVFDVDHPPVADFTLNSCAGSIAEGGWNFEIEMDADATLADIRDRTKVVLFARDWYANTEEPIGPQAGRENIIAIGHIAEESIHYNDEHSIVSFIVQGGQHWIKEIPGFPQGIEQTTGAADAWTNMASLTVDKMMHHLLHWRTTLTQVTDVILTGNALFAKELSAPAGDLWTQIIEIAQSTIFAYPLFDRFNRFFLQIEPLLVPQADRTWDTVRTLTKVDWWEINEVERKTVTPVSYLAMSGVYVSSANAYQAFFALSPGHVYKRYGKIEIMERLLVGTQAQINTLAGNYTAWKNNPLPRLSVRLSANDRMEDMAPNQYLDMNIAAGDTARAFGYTGHWIVRSISYEYDAETGVLMPTLECESEPEIELNVNGDVPADSNPDEFTIEFPAFPPWPALPAFPTLPVPILVPPPTSGVMPSTVLAYVYGATKKGFIYTTNFDEVTPNWTFVNTGLPTLFNPVNFEVTRTGKIFAMDESNGVYRAVSIGGPFTNIFTEAQLKNNFNGYAGTLIWYEMAYDPSSDERIAVLAGQSAPSPNDKRRLFLWEGNGWKWPGGVSDMFWASPYHLSYGGGKWLVIGRTNSPFIGCTRWEFTSTGSGGTAYNIEYPHTASGFPAARAGLSGELFVAFGTDTKAYALHNNGATQDAITLPFTTPATTAYQEVGMDETADVILTIPNHRSVDGGDNWDTVSHGNVANTKAILSLGGGLWITGMNAASGTSLIWAGTDDGDTWIDKTGDALTATANEVKVTLIRAYAEPEVEVLT